MSPCCTICTDSLESKDVVAGNCGHVYHEHCLQRWLQEHPGCPQCRRQINHPDGTTKLFLTDLSEKEKCKALISLRNSVVRDLGERVKKMQLKVEEFEKSLKDERVKSRLSRVFCRKLKKVFQDKSDEKVLEMTLVLKSVLEIQLRFLPHKNGDSRFMWTRLQTIHDTLDSIKELELRDTKFLLKETDRVLTELE